MSTKSNPEDDSLIGGLKYNVKRFNNQYQQSQNTLVKVVEIVVKDWVSQRVEGSSRSHEHLWELVEILNEHKYLEDTSIVGVYTTIGDYTRKNKTTIKAHFTQYGKYYGNCSKLGDKPVGYSGNVRITRDKFKYKFNGDATQLDELFVPRIKK